MGRERRYAAYYRVSTGQQRELGLGLESQRAQVRDYVIANQGRLIGEYSETVSGRKKRSPLARNSAIDMSNNGAALVIARLDRLSRSVAMIARLLDSGVDFVATDFPYANRFTIHVLAAVAEYESQIQSERMKAVLAAVKQRGNKVRNTKRVSTRRFPPGCQQASARASCFVPGFDGASLSNDLKDALWDAHSTDAEHPFRGIVSSHSTAS